MGKERSPIVLMPPVRIVWHAGSVGVLAEPQAVALPPVWRLFLLGDGSTTRSLSLLTGEHICVDVIEMRDAEDDASGPEDLDLIAAPRVRRCVWLCTERGTRLGYATSWWTARHAHNYLTDAALPIGVNLDRLHCAPHRDIRMVFLAHSPCLEAAFGHAGPFWARDYLMRERDEVLCLIREVFSPILEGPLGPTSPPYCEGLDRVS
jgi:chorismate--pyruvate lyase